MNAISLLRNQMSRNRLALAKDQREKDLSENAQQQFRGAFVGYNADRGVDVSRVPQNDGVVETRSVSTGNKKPGQSMMITRPDGSNIGFSDSMPR